MNETRFQFMTGSIFVQHEQRVEGKSITFGYRVNGGPFEPTIRLDFESKEETP
jgi:hypothetical protein